MLLILASQQDRYAQVLVKRWKNHDARLMTCCDLSTAGWRYYPGNPQASRAVISHRVISFEEISGVIIRLPSVLESDLPHIVAADRDYVAAEMTSFLVAWLSEAGFPVINRPTPTCLMGPNWHPAQWACAAAQVGMRVGRRTQPRTPSINTAPETADTKAVTVTVLGERCFGLADDTLKARARMLARRAGVELLAVQFTHPERDAEFVQAFLGADISEPDIADALLDCFLVCA